MNYEVMQNILEEELFVIRVCEVIKQVLYILVLMRNIF